MSFSGSRPSESDIDEHEYSDTGYDGLSEDLVSGHGVLGRVYS